MLIVVGPFMDKLVTGKWILDYNMTPSAGQCLALSCAIAVLVNISQFMCLGRFSAVTFQVRLCACIQLLLAYLLIQSHGSIPPLTPFPLQVVPIRWVGVRLWDCLAAPTLFTRLVDPLQPSGTRLHLNEHQVLGHTKTVLVLLVGWLYLNDVMTLRKVMGILVAVLGMMAYGWATMHQVRGMSG